MTFVYKRSNTEAFLTGEYEFLSYLPRYVSYWKDYKLTNLSGHVSGSFDVSFLETVKLKKFLLKRGADLETFAGVFYGLTLFSQVVHYYRNFIWEYPRPRDREQSDHYPMFQTVNGVLSTRYTHICPAVMPSMVLYIDPDCQNSESVDSRELETALWAEHGDIFDRGVQLALENVDHLVYFRLSGGSSNERLLRTYFNEHAGLRSKILTKNRQGRIINF